MLSALSTVFEEERSFLSSWDNFFLEDNPA